MDDFNKIFNELNIDRALLALIMGVNRSTLIKWIDDGEARTTPTQQPSAAAFTLIKLLQFLKQRDPELFAEFMVIQDWKAPSETYLDNPEFWQAWKWSKHKLNKNVLQYLNENLPDEMKG
ncbi:hypothetical protein [Lelliottia wanjuensis]|uniref:hypothetical protein n=1 Tax=Lelliottia wanjuensis TaxID=3050585 RepID=UPI00254A483F|nr:hypothetical protein [Lelliottia sp. V86_10]MDK9585883.1 hypothetical protein [Lelliottia sp. V86_10]